MQCSQSISYSIVYLILFTIVSATLNHNFGPADVVQQSHNRILRSNNETKVKRSSSGKNNRQGEHSRVESDRMSSSQSHSDSDEQSSLSFDVASSTTHPLHSSHNMFTKLSSIRGSNATQQFVYNDLARLFHM